MFQSTKNFIIKFRFIPEFLSACTNPAKRPAMYRPLIENKVYRLLMLRLTHNNYVVNLPITIICPTCMHSCFLFSQIVKAAKVLE